MTQSPDYDAPRLTAPQRAAITEAVNGPIPEPYGTRAEYVCATVEACVIPPGVFPVVDEQGGQTTTSVIPPAKGDQS